MKHLSIKIYGRVQGVFFRQSTIDKVKNLGISGFVCNEPDDIVYIEAEGEEKDLKELLDWCRQGPNYAKVEKIDFKFSDDLKNFEDFKIEY